MNQPAFDFSPHAYSGKTDTSRAAAERVRPVVENFWDRVDQSGGAEACWPWMRGRVTQNYGTLSIGGKNVLAHRHAYTLMVGPIPDGLFVCHTCDNPPCCNPAHLWAATQQDNVLDCLQKGRNRNRLFFGEKNGSAKLTVRQVEKIRARSVDGETQVSIARDFPVSAQQIGNIVRGKLWRGGGAVMVVM